MPMRWQPAAPMAMQQHGGRIKLADHPEPEKDSGAEPVADEPRPETPAEPAPRNWH
jgi:hypothetical protein